MKDKPCNRVNIESKWDAIYEKNVLFLAANVVFENSFLLPRAGKALDLACGLGGNILFLSRQGLDSYMGYFSGYIKKVKIKG
ncbi:MAG: hypothetical protein HFP81_01330 [Methylococcales symbiont of Hymedesmia sp. n. MRB-2018]|nr:MAG: hypothetical protein HFP78_03505 [Methylococcales symbiont of Hymedesmia sp. n. MRB-2018]KAF3984584.1 MAG: hypothetical protein HFP81_01330 [Methylococcales symbiont of Hymedesmia sp. n. MRB-2018]